MPYFARYTNKFDLNFFKKGIKGIIYFGDEYIMEMPINSYFITNPKFEIPYITINNRGLIKDKNTKDEIIKLVVGNHLIKRFREEPDKLIRLKNDKKLERKK